MGDMANQTEILHDFTTTKLLALEAESIAVRFTSENSSIKRGLIQSLAVFENFITERIILRRLKRALNSSQSEEAAQMLISEIRGAYENGSMETFPSFNPVRARDSYSSNAEFADIYQNNFTSNNRPILFYVAGGGFILPPSKRQKTTVQRMADFTGIEIIMGSHRLAPENPFPIPIDDIISQYQGLLRKHPENKIFLMADTAGASIALGAVQQMKRNNQQLPAGIILFSPWCDLSLSGWSYITKSMTSQSPFRMESAAFCARLYLKDALPTDPLASPIFADLTGFPPILIHTSEYDLHFDDSITLAENGKQQGCDVKINYWDSPKHHLERLSPEDAKVSFNEVVNFVNRILKSDL